MATITKERPVTRKRVTRRSRPAVVRQAEQPEPRVSHLPVERLNDRQDQKRGFVSKVVRTLGDLFIAKYSLVGSRLVSPGEQTVLDAELMAYKQMLPFTMPST